MAAAATAKEAMRCARFLVLVRDTKESRSGSLPQFGLLMGSRAPGEPVDGASHRKRKPKAGAKVRASFMLFCLFPMYQVNKRRRDGVLVMKRRRDVPRHLHLFSVSQNRADRRRCEQDEQQNNALYQLPLLRTVQLLGLQTPQCYPIDRQPPQRLKCPKYARTPTDATSST